MEFYKLRYVALPRLWLLLVLGLLWGCRTSDTVVEEPRVEPYPVVTEKKFTDIPETPREFRGAWVATVDNIDWPSEPGLPVARQKKELTAIFERADSLNLNAIIFQVRPAADALYPSPYEPWSEYLSGRQGRAPDPFYDPLAYAVKEAHRRGMELHAWFNPFRARHPSGGPLAPDHIKNTHPEMVLEYGKYLWLDPGLPSVRQYSIDVIADVVRRYNIDGVHLDDYFYPYPMRDRRGNLVSFPDTLSYGREIKMESAPPINEWRRENVNTFVKRLNEEIKLIDPHIRFGISPFGIWRPGHPRQIKGLDAYNRLFADARKWLQEGWVDYLAPQLYWPIDQKGQSFPVLLKWWFSQNKKDRHLWPGLYTSKLRAGTDAWLPREIERQQQIIRQHPGVSGSIHFSMKAFLRDSSSTGMSRAPLELYEQDALVPATPWLADGQADLAKPKVILQNGESGYRLLLPESEETRWWVVKSRYGDRWQIKIYPGSKHMLKLPEEGEAGAFAGTAVSAVDELGRESPPRQFRVR